MTPQSTVMISAPVTPGKLEQLRSLLAEMNSAPGFADPRNSLVPFWQFSNLHVARFVILDARTNQDIEAHGVAAPHWRPRLCFIADVDGDPDIFLAELVIRAEPGLSRIFAHCDNFSLATGGLLDWLHRHSHQPSANYVNWRGRTVLQVREEQALQLALARHLRQAQSLPHASDKPLAQWRTLKAFVRDELDAGRLRLTRSRPTPLPWLLREVAHLIGVPLILLFLTPLLVLLAPLYFYRLRKLEESDPENQLRPDGEHLAALIAQEDIDVTNHFNVFGMVKPGRLRLLTIRTGLLLLDYTSRHIYRRGYLTRIQTIHFARWVLLDNNRRVYFASNYDGSADTYMDDFINKVAWGLNLVFSNGVGYPQTRWLIKGGARKEENYKRTLRRNQLPSESWYKAYPGLTAVDLARNHRIRQGLAWKNPSEKQVRQWLSLL